jgi:DNA invertase Pin-like site-specific DNA recombinase
MAQHSHTREEGKSMSALTVPHGQTRGHGKRVALYLRVSTGGQSVENQQRELEAVAQRHGWEVAGVFSDQGISGAKGREQRPAFNRLLQGVARKDFDRVAAWSVDRLGRSLRHLVSFLEELQAKGVDLYLHQQALDSSTPAGKAMFQMCGVFAEFERAMIAERVKAGIAKARAHGVRLGPPRVQVDVRQAQALLASGQSLRQVSKALGVSLGTLHRAVSSPGGRVPRAVWTATPER